MKRHEYVAVVAALCLLGLALVGCSHDPMVTYYRSVSTVSIAAQTGLEQLRAADAKKLSGIRDLTKTDPSAAATQLAAWTKTYDGARLGIGIAGDVAKGAMAAAPAVELAVDKNKQANTWVAKLAEAALKIYSVLVDAGAVK